LLDDHSVPSDSFTFSLAVGKNHSIELNEIAFQEGTRLWYAGTGESGSTPCQANSVSSPETDEIHVSLTRKLFSPSLGEELTIEISCPPATVLTIEVFDLAGRRQHTIADSRSFSTSQLTYFGESDWNDRLPVGLYVLRVSSEDEIEYEEKLVFAVAGSR
jgi:hypothetical protein